VKRSTQPGARVVPALLAYLALSAAQRTLARLKRCSSSRFQQFYITTLVSSRSTGLVHCVHTPMASAALCQVPGCSSLLTDLKTYYRRRKICGEHHAAPEILVDGEALRFCQQCALLQPLTDFEPGRRSCIAALKKHNARRKRSAKVRNESTPAA
jgi:hypothetical protein